MNTQKKYISEREREGKKKETSSSSVETLETRKKIFNVCVYGRKKEKKKKITKS